MKLLNGQGKEGRIMIELDGREKKEEDSLGFSFHLPCHSIKTIGRNSN